MSGILFFIFASCHPLIVVAIVNLDISPTWLFLLFSSRGDQMVSQNGQSILEYFARKMINIPLIVIL